MLPPGTLIFILWNALSSYKCIIQSLPCQRASMNSKVSASSGASVSPVTRRHKAPPEQQFLVIRIGLSLCAVHIVLIRWCSVLCICATADQYTKGSHCPNSHDHMVCWWKRNAYSLHVVLHFLLYIESWPQWDGQHWHGKVEAPGDGRGSLVFLSVWAMCSLCPVI